MWSFLSNLLFPSRTVSYVTLAAVAALAGWALYSHFSLQDTRDRLMIVERVLMRALPSRRRRAPHPASPAAPVPPRDGSWQHQTRALVHPHPQRKKVSFADDVKQVHQGHRSSKNSDVADVGLVRLGQQKHEQAEQHRICDEMGSAPLIDVSSG